MSRARANFSLKFILAVQHERAPRTPQVLSRNPPTAPVNVNFDPQCPVDQEQMRTGREKQKIRLIAKEQEMSQNSDPSGQMHFSPPLAASQYHSASPPKYHGQNNNQSPDLPSKKQSFISITSLIDSNEGAKNRTSGAIPSSSVVNSGLAFGQRPTAVGTPPVMFQPSPENLYESAVQLLYMSVTWARNIPTFLDLPFRDQAILLEEGWSELFVLSMAQFSFPLDMGPLLNAAGLQVDRVPTDKIVAGMSDIRLLQNIVSRFRRVEIDSTEYACLKAIVLFKPGETT